LFGEYVDDLNKKFGKGHDNQPVVIIQFAKVKIFRGFFFFFDCKFVDPCICFGHIQTDVWYE
jgi:hypothetical protein